MSTILRLEIDGSWEPQDFIEVLQSFESLYYKFASYHEFASELGAPSHLEIPMPKRRRPSARPSRYALELDELNARLVENSRRSAVEDRLLVSRIQYASPGGIDFVGLGRALDAVERLLGQLITLVTERNIRRQADLQAKIETAILRESLRTQQIANTRDAFRLWDDYPDRGDFLIPLADRDQERLVSRIFEGKLKSVRVLHREGGQGG